MTGGGLVLIVVTGVGGGFGRGIGGVRNGGYFSGGGRRDRSVLPPARLGDHRKEEIKNEQRDAAGDRKSVV